MHAPKDVVFVDTINLDGEMGVRQKYPFGSGIDPNNIQFMQGTVHCTDPSPALETWGGKIIFNQNQSAKLECNNLLLRGSILRKTIYCFGLVIYVGSETKINQNVQKLKIKDSWLLKMTNRLLYFLFLFLAILVTTFTICKWNFDRGFYTHYLRTFLMRYE